MQVLYDYKMYKIVQKMYENKEKLKAMINFNLDPV